MRVNSKYEVLPRTAVFGCIGVKGGYAMFPNTIVKTIPRSLGFSKRIACIRVNSGMGVHRYTAVGHNAGTDNGNIAGVKGSILLVSCSRITRSYAIKGRYVLMDCINVTNRARISS